MSAPLFVQNRGVAQLVARTAGGREVAGSNPVTPTMKSETTAKRAPSKLRLIKNMKTLKLEHHLAELVRQGRKTATWRLYDDKHIAVNDEIELIDKVDAANPTTWVSLGAATVDCVIEKRLGDVKPEDFEGQPRASSREEMLEQYQAYYGPQVSLDTAVKMIHFSLHKKTTPKVNAVVSSTTKLVEAKLYADGGSRGNPGPSASGYAIMQMDNSIVVKKGVYLGVTTNNQAEYQALRLGVEHALSLGIRRLHVYMDSLLVVNQMLGIFKVKNRDLWPIHDAIKQLVASFEHVHFTHVPRALNKIADGQVNEALDAEAANQRARG